MVLFWISQRLLDGELARLAALIRTEQLEGHAVAYMGFTYVWISNLRFRGQNAEAFNRDVLISWRNKSYTVANPREVRFSPCCFT